MIALDSSVIVAAFQTADPRQPSARQAVDAALKEGAVVPVHSMIETYSVLTRLPEPYRVSPAEALAVLRVTFGSVHLASFSARSVWSFLTELADADFGGGLVYDALILRSAEEAGATALLTLNTRHYERLSPRLEIRTPE